MHCTSFSYFLMYLLYFGFLHAGTNTLNEPHRSNELNTENRNALQLMTLSQKLCDETWFRHKIKCLVTVEGKLTTQLVLSLPLNQFIIKFVFNYIYNFLHQAALHNGFSWLLSATLLERSTS
jgi:hypothetical protein